MFCSGNTNLIYSIIRSKAVFYQLANLPEDSYQLVKESGEASSSEKAQEGEDSGRSYESLLELSVYNTLCMMYVCM